MADELVEAVALRLLASKIARKASGYAHLRAGFAAPFPADYEDARAIIPLVQQAERADKWQDIETAPYNTPVIVEVGSGMSFAAQLVPDASINSEDQSCAQWRAVHQGEHPPCWSDGACWQRNENEVMSMQPRRWRALDPEEIVK